MANVLPKFPGRRLPTRRSVAGRIEPALGLRLATLQPGLEPGDILDFEYCIQRVSAQMIDRLEVSVAWYTEGKGSEDIGVHFFESHPRSELAKMALSQPRRIAVKLPHTPLSYEGKLFKIRWCARLRLFLADGREKTAEQRFYLGSLTSEV